MSFRKFLRALSAGFEAVNGERIYLAGRSLYIQNPRTGPVLCSTLGEAITSASIANDDFKMLLESIKQACIHRTCESLDFGELRWSTDGRAKDKNPERILFRWSQYAVSVTAYSDRNRVLEAITRFEDRA